MEGSWPGAKRLTSERRCVGSTSEGRPSFCGASLRASAEAVRLRWSLIRMVGGFYIDGMLAHGLVLISSAVDETHRIVTSVPTKWAVVIVFTRVFVDGLPLLIIILGNKHSLGPHR